MFVLFMAVPAGREQGATAHQVSKNLTKSEFLGQQQKNIWAKPEFFGQRWKKFGKNLDF